MVRGTAEEVKEVHFTCPFYRMHLRPARHSNQHEMLLDLENRGNEVYSSAPAFHELDDLNSAYLRHRVKQRSIWMRPSAIGPLSADGDHHVAFQVPGCCLVCSDRRKIDGPADFESFAQRVEQEFRQRRTFALSEDRLSD